jgi:hypothetical protein
MVTILSPMREPTSPDSTSQWTCLDEHQRVVAMVDPARLPSSALDGDLGRIRRAATMPLTHMEKLTICTSCIGVVFFSLASFWWFRYGYIFGIVFAGHVFTQARRLYLRWRRADCTPDRWRRVMLEHTRCPACGYKIDAIPPIDDITTCPECAAAWRLDR